MIEQLFIGGPLAGWQKIPEEWSRYGVIRYPILNDAAAVDLYEPYDRLRDGTYTARRWFHPSWRTTLTFWMCNDEATQGGVPDGTVLPGRVHGERLEYQILNLDPHGPLPERPAWLRLQGSWNLLKTCKCRNGRSLAAHGTDWVGSSGPHDCLTKGSTMPNGTPEQWDASAQQAEARRQPWPNCANGSCVEVTDRGSRIEFTSTISPDRGLVSYDRDEVSQHILDVKAGRYDHLLTDVPASV